MSQENILKEQETTDSDFQKGWITSEKNTTIKNYKVIYYIFFKYWILLFVIIISIIIFFMIIKKEKTLSINNDNETQKSTLINNLNKKINEIENIEKENTDINIKIKQWLLDTHENMIISYDNLIVFKGFTLPRWTFLYEPDSIKNIEYFNSGNYEIEQLHKFINKIIFVDYDNITSKKAEDPSFIKLENNSIESTFLLSCTNRPRLLNIVCDKYIKNFLEWFYVFKINSDFQWFSKTAKNLVTKKKYKESVCDWLKKYITYSNTAPTEIEDIATLCGWEYLNEFYLIQDFLKVKKELENKEITQTISKYREINEFKLVSYQQILYNNLEKWIPPYWWAYKNYTNYLSNLLNKHKENPINPIYFDITYRYNNLYIIPLLNKVKYQSTSTKKEEIENIIAELEKINNWSSMDWYTWLKNILTNKILEEDVKKIGTNLISQRDDIMSTHLKRLNSLNYLKIINDEIDWNTIKINWYIAIHLKNWEYLPTPFWSTLENKNWNLVVKEFKLNLYGELVEINDILNVILNQKDYSIWEVYDYILNNIWLYLSESLNITPCDLIEQNLENLNIEWLKVTYCDEEKINVAKWLWAWETIFYQIKMEKFNIQTIKCTNSEIQNYIDNNYTNINTNSISISNILPSIIAYNPPKPEDSNTIKWNANTLKAIDDIKTYLWSVTTDIWEKSGTITAEFSISNIEFIWTYDVNTKKLWPLYLKQIWEDGKNVEFNNFEIYLTSSNQYEINKFLVEPVWYLYNLDKDLVSKYLPDLLKDYLEKNKIQEQIQ